jgi:hypothetical protein
MIGVKCYCMIHILLQYTQNKYIIHVINWNVLILIETLYVYLRHGTKFDIYIFIPYLLNQFL